jgi:deoxyribodipyrimidine photolyase
VFNPVVQARRFDSEGAYVSKWAPVAGDAKRERGGHLPIVDHDEARARALAAFRGSARLAGAAGKAGKHPLPSDIQV